MTNILNFEISIRILIALLKEGYNLEDTNSKTVIKCDVK